MTQYGKSYLKIKLDKFQRFLLTFEGKCGIMYIMKDEELQISLFSELVTERIKEKELG